MEASGDEAERLARYACEGRPENGLPAIRRLRALLDDWERAQVAAARTGGWKWSEIGRTLGRSRQAVHARYGDAVVGDLGGATRSSQHEYEQRQRELYEQQLTGRITYAEWQRRAQELFEQLRSGP